MVTKRGEQLLTSVVVRGADPALDFRDYLQGTIPGAPVAFRLVTGGLGSASSGYDSAFDHRSAE